VTHWSKITPSTREFTDSSYRKLHTPSEYLSTDKQKAEAAQVAKQKADIRKEWGMKEEQNHEG
jgi:hypothetical protein